MLKKLPKFNFIDYIKCCVLKYFKNTLKLLVKVVQFIM